MEGMQIIGEIHRNVKKMKSITDPTFAKLIRNQYLMRTDKRWGLLSLYFLEDSPSEDAQPLLNQTVVFRPEVVFQFLQNTINRSQILNHSHGLHNTNRTVLPQSDPVSGQSSELENPQAYGPIREGSREAGLGSQIHRYSFSKSVSPNYHLRYGSHITGNKGLTNAMPNDKMRINSNSALIHNPYHDDGSLFPGALLSQSPLFHWKFHQEKDFPSPGSILSQVLLPLSQANIALTFRPALQANLLSALNSVNQPKFIAAYSQREGPKLISAFRQTEQPNFTSVYSQREGLKLISAFRQTEQLNFTSAFSQRERPRFTSASIQANQLNFVPEFNPVSNSATRPGFTGVFTPLIQRGFSSPLKTQFTLVRNPVVIQKSANNREYPENGPLLWSTSELISELIGPKTPTFIGGGYPRTAKSGMDSTDFQWGANLLWKEAWFKEQDHKESLIREHKETINQDHPLQKERLRLLSFLEPSFYKYFTDNLQTNLSQNFRQQRNFSKYPDIYPIQNFQQRFSPLPGTWLNAPGANLRANLREPRRFSSALNQSRDVKASLPTLAWGYKLITNNFTGFSPVSARSPMPQSKFPFLYNRSLKQTFNRAILSRFPLMPGPAFVSIYKSAFASIYESAFTRIYQRLFQPTPGWEFTPSLDKSRGRSEDRQLKKISLFAKDMEFIQAEQLKDLVPDNEQYMSELNQSLIQGLTQSASQNFAQSLKEFTQSLNRNSNDYPNPNPDSLRQKELNRAGDGRSEVYRLSDLFKAVSAMVRPSLPGSGAVSNRFSWNLESGRIEPNPQPLFNPVRGGRFNANLTLSLFLASEKAGMLSSFQKKNLRLSSSAPSGRSAEPLLDGQSIFPVILLGDTVFAGPILSQRNTIQSFFPVRPVFNSRLLSGGHLSTSISDRVIDKVIDRIIPGMINRVEISHRAVLNNSLSPVTPAGLVNPVSPISPIAPVSLAGPVSFPTSIGLGQETVVKAGSGKKLYPTRPSLGISSFGMPHPRTLHLPAAVLNAPHFSTPYLNTLHAGTSYLNALHADTSTLYFLDLYTSLTNIPGRDHPVSDHVTPNLLDSSREILITPQLKNISLAERANQWLARILITPRTLMTPRTPGAPGTPGTPRGSMTPGSSGTPWEIPGSLIYWESWNRESLNSESSDTAPSALRNAEKEYGSKEKLHQGRAELKNIFRPSGLRLIEKLLGNVYRTLTHNHMEKYLAGKESFEKSVAGNPLLTLLKNDPKSEEQERGPLESSLVENYASFKSELEKIKNLFAVRQFRSPQFKIQSFKFPTFQSGSVFSPALSNPLPTHQNLEAWLFHRRGQGPLTILRERSIPRLDGEKDIKVSRDLRTVSRYGESTVLLQADEARRKELRTLRNTQLVALANPIAYQDREGEGPEMIILAPPVIAQDYNSGYTQSLPTITYREEEEKHRLNKQHEPVMKSLNTPVEIASPSLKQSIQNVDFMNPTELNRLVDKVYSQLETRLKREKRRFGF
ncbi:hypothetical protein [Desulfitobacterium chlororespirans]|uniref:Uncharacterized protein n=1 Tax=Desulfitobacterium chlororespirans DSM 11544 TaxID=1121395 RepID=A0A1M7TZ27_9FIRM|nr:hypothetical protein [Desulfitobacterium chlororespirans]SHN76022.1 hypothetical protein SAMN02745215_02785 [Desulfitobacterium chlororespirans DSM 11544]